MLYCNTICGDSNMRARSAHPHFVDLLRRRSFAILDLERMNRKNQSCYCVCVVLYLRLRPLLEARPPNVARNVRGAGHAQSRDILLARYAWHRHVGPQLRAGKQGMACQNVTSSCAALLLVCHGRHFSQIEERQVTERMYLPHYGTNSVVWKVLKGTRR